MKNFYSLGLLKEATSANGTVCATLLKNSIIHNSVNWIQLQPNMGGRSWQSTLYTVLLLVMSAKPQWHLYNCL